MNIAELLPELLKGILHFTWGNAVMIAVALILIYLAVFKEIEPVLLLPIGFGCLLANIPLAGMTSIEELNPELKGIGNYEFGWADSDDAGATATRGLNEDVVRDISAKKSEPEWMTKLRLKGLRLFGKKPMPNWGSDLSTIDFDNIKYFVRSSEKQATSWEDLPEDIKNTYDKLGIPEAEKQRLIAGVAAQYECARG